MIIIAEPYAKFERSLSTSQLEAAAPSLLVFAERRILPYYKKKYGDVYVEVSVQLEQGSTRAWIKVGSVIALIAIYGDLRQGIDELIDDARTIGDIVLPEVQNTIGLQGEDPQVRQRRLGAPGQLHRLFVSVEHHEMTADEASEKAEGILAANADGEGGLRGLVKQLAKEFRETYNSSHKEPRRTPMPPRQPVAVDTNSGRRRGGIIARRVESSGRIEIDAY